MRGPHGRAFNMLQHLFGITPAGRRILWYSPFESFEIVRRQHTAREPRASVSRSRRSLGARGLRLRRLIKFPQSSIKNFECSRIVSLSFLSYVIFAGTRSSFQKQRL
ncbi:hypothetical protein ATY76_02140 [Rhizobium sp. R339]|nr:hypothetical protein ATY76_02140 [Rhizobium sp. R339]